jgi:protein gp37
MGTTVDLQARVKAAEDAFAHITAGVRWLSIEPMLEPLRFQHLERFQWIVLGGSSESKATDGSPATPEWRPPYRWIEDLVRQADAVGCKVYMKTNLLGKRRLKLPFDEPLIGEDALAPAVFSYLKASPREEDTL